MAEQLTGQPEWSMSQLPLGERWGDTLDKSSCPCMAGLRDRQPHALTCTWPSPAGALLILMGLAWWSPQRIKLIK